MKANLIRFRDHLADATPGLLVLIPSGWSCHTLERPWLENEQNVSCIPSSELAKKGNSWDEPHLYTVIPHVSPTRGDCFAVLDVLARTDILIHRGNSVQDTEGCILVGLGRIGDRLIHSRAALSELMTRAPDGFQLEIIYG